MLLFFAHTCCTYFDKVGLTELHILRQTAEMPDFYADGEYDLSGFAVGIVKKDSVIDGKNIVIGDVLIGLPSSGVHSNGFSLVRRLVLLRKHYILFAIDAVNLKNVPCSLTL